MIIQFSSESFLFKRKDHIAALLYSFHFCWDDCCCCCCLCCLLCCINSWNSSLDIFPSWSMSFRRNTASTWNGFNKPFLISILHSLENNPRKFNKLACCFVRFFEVLSISFFVMNPSWFLSKALKAKSVFSWSPYLLASSALTAHSPMNSSRLINLKHKSAEPSECRFILLICEPFDVKGGK